ncbi:MAG: hypothetical protein ABI776_01590 [Nocardioidaceae bacterium]
MAPAQHLPFAPLGDAAREIDTAAGWAPEVVQAYVDRVVARVATYAPGLGETVLATHAISRTDLVAHNANAVAGDPYGGAGELDQSLLWRPGSATGHRTCVDGLFQDRCLHPP